MSFYVVLGDYRKFKTQLSDCSQPGHKTIAPPALAPLPLLPVNYFKILLITLKALTPGYITELLTPDESEPI